MAYELNAETLILLIAIAFWYRWLWRYLGRPPWTDSRNESSTGPNTSPPYYRGNGRRHGGNCERPVASNPAVAAALDAIRAEDRSFDAAHFLEHATAAYEAILTAFQQGDARTLAYLTSPDVFEVFTAEIVRRDSEREKLEWSLLRILATEIIDAQKIESLWTVTVRFSSEYIASTRQLKDGDEDQRRSTTLRRKDEWTFGRDPQGRNRGWKLVGTAVS